MWRPLCSPPRYGVRQGRSLRSDHRRTILPWNARREPATLANSRSAGDLSRDIEIVVSVGGLKRVVTFGSRGHSAEPL